MKNVFKILIICFFALRLNAVEITITNTSTVPIFFHEDVIDEIEIKDNKVYVYINKPLIINMNELPKNSILGLPIQNKPFSLITPGNSVKKVLSNEYNYNLKVSFPQNINSPNCTFKRIAALMVNTGSSSILRRIYENDISPCKHVQKITFKLESDLGDVILSVDDESFQTLDYIFKSQYEVVYNFIHIQ